MPSVRKGIQLQQRTASWESQTGGSGCIMLMIEVMDIPVLCTGPTTGFQAKHSKKRFWGLGPTAAQSNRCPEDAACRVAAVATACLGMPQPQLSSRPLCILQECMATKLIYQILTYFHLHHIDQTRFSRHRALGPEMKPSSSDLHQAKSLSRVRGAARPSLS